jgi:hypothetical protein
MKATALRVGICCAGITLLAAGCGDGGTTTRIPDGGGPEVGTPADAALSGQDVAPIPPDTREVGLVTEVPGSAGDAPAEGPSDDAPVTGLPETGGEAPGLAGDGAGPGEAGEDSPQVTPDGGLTCGQAGAICKTAADCCGLACILGTCADTACLSDGNSCATGGECCSTVCGTAGICVPLNPSCKTAGNTCVADDDCCGKVCNAAKQCAAPSAISYCAQAGDICRGDIDCCTAVCDIAAGKSVGTCAAISTSCLIDGTVCNGCGACCSHFCGPFGSGGPNICQPASGCHVQGDLCHADSDCCGGDVASGLPGAGLVKCEPDPVHGSRIGTCGGPRASNCPSGVDTCKNSCNPEGDVCHYHDTAVCAGAVTSKRNDCCACISGKDCCQLDRAGIPRCNALTTCVPVGGNCSFSDECCDHEPCLPDPATGHLTCGSACVPVGGLCTTNADCCAGMVCEVAPGSLAGTCTIPTPPTTPPDAGAVDAPPICAYYGQFCSPDIPCCNDIACVNSTFAVCTAADTDCVCWVGE